METIFNDFKVPGGLGRDILQALGVILEALGIILETFGVRFGRSEGTLGRLRRAIAFNDRWWHSAAPRFKRFWRPKGAQKAPKMELKPITNPPKNLSK